MIFTQSEKIIKRIRRDTIQPNDKKGLYKLWLVANYLVNESSYRPCRIKKELRRISLDYFSDTPDSNIESIIEDIFQECNTKKERKSEIVDCNDDEADEDNKSQENKHKPLIFYTTELDTLRKLDSPKAQYLGFVFLAYYKLIDGCTLKKEKITCEWRKEKLSDLMRIAQISVSGTTKAKLLRLLCDNGIIEFRAIIDHKYMMGCHHEDEYGRERKIASVKFRMPIAQIDGEVAFTVAEPDDDTLINYYLRYYGDDSIIDCSICHCPIVKTNNRIKYCKDCASSVKHKCVKIGN
jgi:hypothetical protein